MKIKNKLRYLLNYRIIAKSEYFNADWYLKQNPDVKNAGVNPVTHYLQNGWQEGRNPSEWFNGNEYLHAYQDVKKENINPLLHYEKHGKKEGRKIFKKDVIIINDDSFIIKGYKGNNIWYTNNQILDIKIQSINRTGISNKTNKKSKIIISLTSFSERMKDIKYALYSLLNQTYKPDMIILWLGKDEFPNRDKDLPSSVLKLKNYGLTINYTNDLRSYGKLIPALKAFPNDVIITADDDVYYCNTWLEKLIIAYNKNRNMIHCYRAHRVEAENNKILGYDEWKKEIKDEKPSFLNFFTGVGGVLYPPKILDKEVFNKKVFQDICPYADDIWFWAMAIKNNTKINVIENPLRLVFVNPQRELRETNEITLAKLNLGLKKNDEQLNKVLDWYNLLNKLIFTNEIMEVIEQKGR